jgi:hypothetical protein
MTISCQAGLADALGTLTRMQSQSSEAELQPVGHAPLAAHDLPG